MMRSSKDKWYPENNWEDPLSIFFLNLESHASR